MTPRTAKIRSAAGDERGSTLLELLVAVSIMASAFVGIMSLLTTLSAVSLSHRQATHEGVLVTQVAEGIARMNYIPCGTAAQYATALSSLPGDAPNLDDWTNYELVVAEVRYLQSKATPTPAFVASCPSPDQGVQLITVAVEAIDSQRAEIVDFHKRNFACPANYATVAGDNC